MSTHIFLDDAPSEHQRSILEACPCCAARAGEPCIVQHGDYEGLFMCPDANCDQLYRKVFDAMGCAMHETAAG